MKNLELVYAEDYQEFFFEDSNEYVPEGELVGVKISNNNQVSLVLLDNIYHNIEDEL